MKFVKSAALAFALFLISQIPASAQSVDSSAGATPVIAQAYPFSDLRAFSIGIVIFGAALGIGGLAKSAVESMARQPEMAGTIQLAMIIAAALIEGVALFALVIVGFVLKA